MNIKAKLTKSIISAAVAAALISPAIASAQDAPYASGDQQIQGTIASIDGTWNIAVNDSNGYTDDVALHQGTIINPTGLTLEPGMNVTIDGYADGNSFDANEIDTPYQYDGPAPAAVYYGPGAWYPGYATGWGPSFNLVFDVGSHRYEQRAFNFGGQIRRPVAPPSGWQDRPHGYIGNAGNVHAAPRTAYVQPQERSFAQPQRIAPQQQARDFAPQQQRNLAPQVQQQQRSFAPQQRSFAPQQQRSFAPQQPQRSFAPAARGGGSAPRATGDRGGDHHRG